jgi:iron complex outermembrane receptor protein
MYKQEPSLGNALRGRYTLRVLFSTLIAASSHAALAQAPAETEASDRSAVLEEIIVTANKREESLQDVAQVVNVVTGDFLEDLEIRSFQELSTTVAGLSLSRVSGGEQSASMRGIKMENPGGAASATNTVEMYVNEVPITAVDSFNSLFDIGQVEVLRGPQGTLRGRPSPSGAITIAPRRGSFTESDAYLQLGASENGGANLQAAWGGPLSDNVSLRVAGFSDESDDNGFRSLLNGKRSRHESTALRATLAWAPGDNFELIVMHQENDQEQDFYRGVAGTAPPTSVAAGQTFTYEDRISLNGENPNSYEASLTTVGATYNFENYALNYVGGYKDSHFRYVLDFNFAGLPNPALQYLLIDSDNQVQSNELRFESTTGEIYNFTVGMFISTSDFNGGFAVVPFVPYAENPYTLEDTGYFMNHRFEVGERNSVSVGIRRSEYSVDRSGAGVDVDFNATTGNASFQRQFSDTVMGYVSYGKSFRPGTGGVGVPANAIPARYANANDESSTSLEIGVKTEWLDRRLTLNLALYDQAYDGFIAVTNNVACTTVPNPSGLAFATVGGLATGPACRQNVRFNGDSVAQGLDLELRALVTDDWTVGVNYAYVDAHFDNALVPCNDYNGDGAVDNVGVARIQQGQFVSECRTNAALGQIAPNSLSVNTAFDFELGRLGAYVRANAIYNDESYFPQTGLNLPSDTRVNAYVGIRGQDEKWEVSLWAKNLFDNVVQDNDGGNAGGFGGPLLNIGTVTYGREFGLTFRRDFF